MVSFFHNYYTSKFVNSSSSQTILYLDCLQIANWQDRINLLIVRRQHKVIAANQYKFPPFRCYNIIQFIRHQVFYSQMKKNIVLIDQDSREKLPKFQPLVGDRMRQIGHLLAQIDRTTDQFDTKLSRFIQFNEKQFISSYQNHMRQVREELQLLRNQVQEKDKIISTYQSEGIISDLLKRINFLELEQSKLLKSLLKKDEQIIILRTENKIDQTQKRKMEERIKDLSKQKPKSHEKLVNINKNYESTQTISTQIFPQQKSPGKQRLFFQPYQSKMKKIKFMQSLKSSKHKSSIVSDFDEDSQNGQLKKLQKKVITLEKQLKKLREDNAKIAKEYEEGKKFFISLVNEMRQDIKTRKKIKYCSFENFLKEDKISLLIKILSNTELLEIFYRSIFPDYHSPKNSTNMYNDITKQRNQV